MNTNLFHQQNNPILKYNIDIRSSNQYPSRVFIIHQIKQMIRFSGGLQKHRDDKGQKKKQDRVFIVYPLESMFITIYREGLAFRIIILATPCMSITHNAFEKQLITLVVDDKMKQ